MPVIDDVARIIGGELPRREMIVRVGRLLAGAFLAGFTVRRASAFDCIATPCAAGLVCCAGITCCDPISTVCCGEGGCCGSDQACCNGTCTSLASDPNNCGACGTSCPGADTCQLGICMPPTCVGVSCPLGSVCIAGECVFPGAPADAHQVIDPSNLTIGDSVINITNAGTRNGFDPAGGICANVYAFDASEEMISCCSCYVSPDALRSISIQQDILSNTLTPGRPDSVVVKLVASTPLGASTCDPASLTGASLEPGMRAWGTKLHLNTTSGKYNMTEIPSRNADLSPSELLKLTTYCGFIQANGSSFGICKSCRFGGLGGASQ